MEGDVYDLEIHLCTQILSRYLCTEMAAENGAFRGCFGALSTASQRVGLAALGSYAKL